jgi:hypothetical protein
MDGRAEGLILRLFKQAGKCCVVELSPVGDNKRCQTKKFIERNVPILVLPCV